MARVARARCFRRLLGDSLALASSRCTCLRVCRHAVPRLAAPEKSLAMVVACGSSMHRLPQCFALCLLGRTDGRMWLVRLFGFESSALQGGARSHWFRLPYFLPLPLRFANSGAASGLPPAGIPHMLLWWIRDMWVCGAHRFFLGLVDS